MYKKKGLDVLCRRFNYSKMLRKSFCCTAFNTNRAKF